MTIKYRDGDLFFTEDKCIVHGCNAVGVMGSGVAKIVKAKYPQAFRDYEDYCFNTALNKRLGTNVVSYSNGKIIVNAITQSGFGKDGAKYVSYDAIHSCFMALHDDVRIPQKISIPKIGAGLGGGAWPVIASIINECTNGYKEVTVWDPGDAPLNYDDSTPEHMRKAIFWSGRVGQYGSMHITRDWSKRLSVDIRIFSGPEVQWQHCFALTSPEQAREIINAGLATEWLGALSDV